MSASMFDIDITLQRGPFRRAVRVDSDARVLAITGASGAGKTSLLHAIAGLLTPGAGHIRIAGDTLFDATTRIDLPAHRRHVGYVFQDGRLFPHRSVRGNLLFGASRDASPAFAFEHVVDLLGLAPLLERRTQALSGGEVQRVAIGRALLSQPRLLLLDEPLSMLDPDRRDELLPFLRRVHDDVAIPIVYVSHQVDEVRRLADHVHRID